MKIQQTFFIEDAAKGGKDPAFSLRKLKAETEIHAAAQLLCQALLESNQLVGKTLYCLEVESEQIFLANISELYGVFETITDQLIAMIAVEEDSIERIAVAKSYQRRGLGRALLYFAHQQLSAEYMDIYADNVPALRLLTDYGFSMFDETAPEPGDLMAEDPHTVIHLML